MTETILDIALLFAEQHCDISNDNTTLIKFCRKSLIFSINEAWKKKQTESCSMLQSEVLTVRTYANLSVFAFCVFLAKLINKKDFDLYRDDGLLIYANCKQINQMRKNIIKIFKDIGFAIDVETNFKIVDLIDITLNWFINDLLLQINKSSNHPPQIINQLPKIINERLSKNWCSEEVTNLSKYQYQTPISN